MRWTRAFARTFAIPARPVAGCEFYTGDCRGAFEKRHVYACVSSAKFLASTVQDDRSKRAMVVQTGMDLSCCGEKLASYAVLMAVA